MVYLGAGIVVFALAAAGFSRQKCEGGSRVPPVAVALALMYVVVRSAFDELAGSRPTGAITLTLAVACVAYCAGRQPLTSRGGFVAVLGLMAIYVIAFRGDYQSDLAISALTLVAPAVFLGVLSHRSSMGPTLSALRGMAGLLALLLLASGAVLDGRLTLPNENPIWIGRASALAMVAFVYWRGIGRTRWVLVTVCAVVLLLTGSRAPLWGAVLGIAIAQRASISRRWRTILLGGVLGLTVALGAGGADWRRIASLGIAREGSIEVRQSLWQDAIEVWMGHIWFGTGAAYDSRGLAQASHNAFLELLAQGGVVAATILAVGVVIAFRRTLNHHPPMASLLACSIVVALLSGSVWVNLEMWMLIAWALSLPRPPKSDGHSGGPESASQKQEACTPMVKRLRFEAAPV